MIKIAYDPNEKQKKFHASGATELVYGGAKGGGKTAALVIDGAAYACEYPNSTVYFFRETYDDLESNIIAEWKKRMPPEIYRYNETKRIATMYNGSKVWFRYVQDKRDAEKYDGRTIDYIGVDELTKHEEATIQQLLSCLRSPLGFPPRFRGTCNPGGIGHSWVKNRYITPTDKGKKVYREDVTNNEIAFVPATVYDNYAIMMNDPAYVRRLENLPPKKRQAYLLGDWDMYDGQAFEEFDYNVHVIKPFAIPDHWYRWVSCDNGFTDPFAWYWFAVDEVGLVYIYREFTRKPGDPKITYSDQAKKVLELSLRPDIDTMKQKKEKIVVIYAGHDAFASSPLAPGKSISYYYTKAGLAPILSSIPDRKLRKATWHEYLKVFEHNGTDIAKVRIFDTCTQLIETLPKLCEDEKDAEKVASCSIDHWYDGAGYGLMSYHLSKTETKVVAREEELPPELRTTRKEIGYADVYGAW